MSAAATTVQTAVIGAGVVGLAIARALATRGHEVIVIESAPIIGSGTSSRNSEVVHAGIYYPAGSLKARACVEGRGLLYAFADRYNIPHNKCGKLIVANSEEELASLDGILAKGEANGVHDLEMISSVQVAEMEPECRCLGAILSPSTGIVDSHAFMQALQGHAEDHGAVVAFNSAVHSGRVLPSGHTELFIHDDAGSGDGDGGGEALDSIVCRNVVNAAGLYAPHIATRISGVPAPSIPPSHFAKGNYFSLEGPSPFSMLVYPVPVKNTAGLGVHATIDMQGRTKFGPDVEWLDRPDLSSWSGAGDVFVGLNAYDVDESRAKSFYQEIRRYYPGLKDGSIVADYSGIRPKISAPGEAAEDFVASTPTKGHVHLYGIESPGLTSSLFLAEHVASLHDDHHFFP